MGGGNQVRYINLEACHINSVGIEGQRGGRGRGLKHWLAIAFLEM